MNVLLPLLYTLSESSSSIIPSDVLAFSTSIVRDLDNFLASVLLRPVSEINNSYVPLTLRYSMDLDIRTWSCCGSPFFYNIIFQRNYGKMTMKWSSSYNFFVKLSLYNMVHL